MAKTSPALVLSRWVSIFCVVVAGACGSSDDPMDGGNDGAAGLSGAAGSTGGGGGGNPDGTAGAAGGGTDGSAGSGGCAPNAGALDATFGIEGLAVTHFASMPQARAVAVLPDGKIVVGAGSILARFASNGELESGGSYAIDGNALAVQDDGKFVLAGAKAATGGDSFVLLRFNMDGTPDLGFGGSGGVVTTFSLMEATVTALTIQPADGRIIAAGIAGGQFAAARYDKLGGALDTSFGAAGQRPGVVTTTFSTAVARAQAVAVQGDGRVVLGGCSGTAAACSTSALARYGGDGVLDASFGSGGKLSDQRFPAITGVAAPSAGVVAVGADVVTRYKQSDGTLDTTFAGTGTTQGPVAGSLSIHAVAVTADRRVIAVGSLSSGAGAAQRAVVFRLGADGTLDACFGTGGVTTFAGGSGDNVARAVARQPDGKIVIAGQAGTDLLVARLIDAR